ncbi:MAG: CpaF family protein [Acidobacteria bacterium]|jgi:pilus assembly protein CpaF|nr:CpaF family protein [Acidobacteriota bacterium]
MADVVTMTPSNGFGDLKLRIHSKILEEIDSESLSRLNEQTGRERVRLAIRDMLQRERTPLAHAEREQVVVDIVDELFGLGPIEPLLADPAVSDILINGSQKVYIERRGLLEKTDIRFADDRHLMRIVERIVSRVGRRVDESSPMVDARLPDGSRVNVIIPPLSLEGPVVSIRRFGHDPLTALDLLGNSTLIRPMLDLLEATVRGKLNIMISGGTGAGKTTLLNVLSSFIPENERIVTIEDAAELQLKQEHVVRLETRPANIEGKGAVRQRQLVINALRMRPDRIVVGEVRGEEAVDMLQAMNTGHEGSLTTIHSNSPRDALMRLETMASMANLNLPERAIRQQIASAINIIVQVARLPDGTRKLTTISEITGMEGPVITMQDLFVFERHGFDKEQRVRGRFRPEGIRPKFGEKLLARGVSLDVDMFLYDQQRRAA